MAIYEYRCGTCGTEFESRRPMSEAGEPAPCPKCGGEGSKLPSVFASKDGYSLKLPSAAAFRGKPAAKPKPARKARASAPPSRGRGAAAQRSRGRQ